MSRIRTVIEVYCGVVQNVYVAQESPETLVEAVIVDWDYEHYDAGDDCVVPATGLDGIPTLASVSIARLKPWRLLPAAGIQDVLDRVGLAEFAAPYEAGEPAGQTPEKSGAFRAKPNS